MDWATIAGAGASVAAGVAAIGKAVRALGFIKDILKVLAVTVGAAMGNEGGALSAQKKAAAVADIKAQLALPGGVDLPKWLEPHQDWLFGFYVDMAVRLLNSLGFFGKSSASSPPSS